MDNSEEGQAIAVSILPEVFESNHWVLKGTIDISQLDSQTLSLKTKAIDAVNFRSHNFFLFLFG